MTKKQQPAMYRQGDVLCVATSEKIEGEKEAREADGALVLAHGESTGHRHAFRVGKDAGEIVANKARRQLMLMRTSALLHEEHSTVDIPGGLYDLPRQVEMTDQDEPRTVAD